MARTCNVMFSGYEAVPRAGGHQHRLIWLDDSALLAKPNFRGTFDHFDTYFSTA